MTTVKLSRHSVLCIAADLIALSLLSLLLVSVTLAGGSQVAIAKEKPLVDRGVNRQLADGIYLVLGQDKDRQNLGRNNQIVLLNDFHYLEPVEREPKIYVLLQKAPFVPLLINGKPHEDKEEGSNKPRMQLTLQDEQIEPLKAFTTTNLGKTIAIVIGGDIVTTHIVRQAITGGHLQITRCTKHGCETLYTRLLKDK